MDMKAVFGIASSIILIIGGLPYLYDIHRQKIRPHILSWLGWSFITALGAFAVLADGGGWVVAMLFANTVLCLLMAGYSIFKKVGVWSASIYDFLFFGVGLLGLILWQVSGEPIVAIIFAVIADFCFGVPTIIKTYKNPQSETYFAWLASVVAELLALFAVKHYVFSELVYPVYLLIFDAFVLGLVLGLIGKKPKR